MIRTPEALIPYILALAALLVGLLWHLGDEAARPNHVATYGAARIGGPFALTDQNGFKRTDKDFRGRFMLVYFGYSNCPDVCPVTLGVMADAMAKLGPAADRIAPIFITVDPARDTPSVLAAYVKSFGPRFTALTGSPAAIAKTAREYRVYFARQPQGGGYAVNHTSTIYLMDASGRFIADYDESIGPDALAEDLRKRP